MNGVLVLGSGGHGKVVADILLQDGQHVLGFLDDDRSTWGTQRLGLPVLGSIESFTRYLPSALIVGVGSNLARREIVERLGDIARQLWCTAIHPRASIAPSTALGRGVAVMAGAVINADSVVGDHVIINTGATVDHDCKIGEYTHVAPGAHIAGEVTIGSDTLIGAGAVVIPGCSIGNRVVIGAGAVVVHDMPDGVTAKGLPARWQAIPER